MLLVAHRTGSVPSLARVRCSTSHALKQSLIDHHRELKPRLAALKDPEARKEVELHVRDLARRGHLISEAKRKLDAILRERGESW